MHPYDLFQNNLDILKAKVVLKIKELGQAPDDRKYVTLILPSNFYSLAVAGNSKARLPLRFLVRF